MIVADAVTRLVPGVIKEESIEEKRTFAKTIKKEISKPSVASYPVYTRPEVFSPKRGVLWGVPPVLLSGNHKKIEEWRKKHIE